MMLLSNQQFEPAKKLNVSKSKAKESNFAVTTFRALYQIAMKLISNIIKRIKNMIASLFQTASGAWHVQSILIASGWIVTGIFLFFQLSANRAERLKAFDKEQQQLRDLTAAHAEITELKKKTTPKPFDVRLRSLLDEIDPQILKRFEDGETGFLTVNVPQELHRTLLRLYKEKGSDKYITIDRSVHDGKPLIGIGIPGGTYVVTKIKLSPNLINQKNK